MASPHKNSTIAERLAPQLIELKSCSSEQQLLVMKRCYNASCDFVIDCQRRIKETAERQGWKPKFSGFVNCNKLCDRRVE